MRAVYERFLEHSPRIELAYNYYMAPETYESEVLAEFYSQDTANAIEINRQYSLYGPTYPLHHAYCIYGAGAPFERLFFEARKQAENAILELSYERKKREFNAQTDPRFDDFNFIEAYARSQDELRDAREQVCDYDYRLWTLRGKLDKTRRSARRWRRKYLEQVGDEFVDRPASV